MKSRTAVVLAVILVAGVVAASQLGAQTPVIPTAAPTTPGIATIQSIVEITRPAWSGRWSAGSVCKSPSGVRRSPGQSS